MSEKSFSQKLQRLEEIVGLLEQPDLELEEGLKLLEEGVTLHQQCQKLLTQAQVKVDRLLDSQSGTEDASPEHSEDKPVEQSLFEHDTADSLADKQNLDASDNRLPF